MTMESYVKTSSLSLCVCFLYDYCNYIENDPLMRTDNSTETEDGTPIRKLFISNLAERTTYKDLTKLFSEYGHVENCFLRRNEGISNYAFITFDSVESAARARCRYIILHNRNLRIVPADSWHQPDNIENQYYNKNWQKSDKKQSNEQCSQDFVQNDITNNSIQILNDDCLMHVFLQLPIVDRIRIERVCKRWRAVIQESWCKVKKLDISCMRSSASYIERSKLNKNGLRKVLLRCGRFLNEIDLSLAPYSLHESTVTIVGKFCPNLQRINFTSLTVSAAGINSLTNNCHNITKLSLGPTKYICDKDLQKLFKVNKKLRYLNIIASKICGWCLLHLPLETIEIVLIKCEYLQESYLSQAIKKLQNLESLTIDSCFDISSNAVQTIGTCCTNLKTLGLSNISCSIESSDMLYITELTNLEVLKIYENEGITDEFLCKLIPKCQHLTYIDITDCYYINDIGITVVATLPKLETLIMNYLTLLTSTDISLRDMYNLKKLECRQCNLTDNTFIELIASAPLLELLDLSECSGVTNLTLEKAAAVTLNRTNNTILKIFVGRTSVNLEKFDKISPFLHIVNVDFVPTTK
ncbi:putative RNA-binding protein EEED8.10 [Colletes latitarsis]|uniref:putative RNA-binding protein EEED8.10 n=1 Tax=Colletes latitarsis TaxID=2605962 RepID=UPI00403684F0